MPLIPFPKPLRFLEFIGVLLHKAIITKYSHCFIPDLPGELNLSGRLSHGFKLPGNVRFTGILSRFTSSEEFQKVNPVEFRHTTIILSGPEPQRELLKRKLSHALEDKEPCTVVLEGKPGRVIEIVRSGNILYYNHLPASEMKEMVTGSEGIISRSGYTTIMELITLNCSALLIPTPGQTEQEYLAGYMAEKGWFHTISQSDINAGISLPSTKAKWPCGIVSESKILLTTALEELLQEDHKKE